MEVAYEFAENSGASAPVGFTVIVTWRDVFLENINTDGNIIYHFKSYRLIRFVSFTTKMRMISVCERMYMNSICNFEPPP